MGIENQSYFEEHYEDEDIVDTIESYEGDPIIEELREVIEDEYKTEVKDIIDYLTSHIDADPSETMNTFHEMMRDLIRKVRKENIDITELKFISRIRRPIFGRIDQKDDKGRGELTVIELANNMQIREAIYGIEGLNTALYAFVTHPFRQHIARFTEVQDVAMAQQEWLQTKRAEIVMSDIILTDEQIAKGVTQEQERNNRLREATLEYQRKLRYIYSSGPLAPVYRTWSRSNLIGTEGTSGDDTFLLRCNKLFKLDDIFKLTDILSDEQIGSLKLYCEYAVHDAMLLHDAEMIQERKSRLLSIQSSLIGDITFDIDDVPTDETIRVARELYDDIDNRQRTEQLDQREADINIREGQMNSRERTLNQERRDLENRQREMDISAIEDEKNKMIRELSTYFILQNMNTFIQSDLSGLSEEDFSKLGDDTSYLIGYYEDIIIWFNTNIDLFSGNAEVGEQLEQLKQILEETKRLYSENR